MGIRHYNCDVCEDIFPDVNEHKICLSCKRRWCENCMGIVLTFRYGHHDFYCEDCDPSKPTEVKDNELLIFALEKLDMSKEELQQALRKDRGEEEEEEENVEYFSCSINHDDCNPGCTTVGDIFEPPKDQWDWKKGKEDVDAIIGWCCKAKYDEHEMNKWCDVCRNKKLKV